jgi:hypothetical protein
VNVEQMAAQVVEAARGYVERSLASVRTKLADLEQRIAAIPRARKDRRASVARRAWTGPPARRARAARPAWSARRACPGIRARTARKVPAGDRGPQGEKGEKGDPGEPGAAGEPGPEGPAGKDGAPGQKGDVGDRGEPGVMGKDGRDGIDGKDGRDALQIDVLPAIDASKSYPRGTFAHFRGGIVRSFRATDPIEEAPATDFKSPEECGWAVAMNGIATVNHASLDEGRTIVHTLALTSGDVVEHKHAVAAMIYREVWKEGADYARGDVATWGGSAWHCQVEKTQDKPARRTRGNSW